jgi:hypothetical protein
VVNQTNRYSPYVCHVLRCTDLSKIRAPRAVIWGANDGRLSRERTGERRDARRLARARAAGGSPLDARKSSARGGPAPAAQHSEAVTALTPRPVQLGSRGVRVGCQKSGPTCKPAFFGNAHRFLTPHRVDGSSPSEGPAKALQTWPFPLFTSGRLADDPEADRVYWLAAGPTPSG